MSQLSDAIVPKRSELALYFGLSIFVLLLANLPTISDLFVDDELTRLSVSVFHERAHSFVSTIDSFDLTGRLSLAIFWGMFGLVLYIISFTFWEVYQETRAEVVAQSRSLHHPAHFNQETAMRRVVLRLLTRLAAFVALISLSIVTLTFGLPLAAQLVRDVSYADQHPLFWADPVLGILFMAITMHAFVVLLRLLLLRPRLTEHAQLLHNLRNHQ